MRYVAVVCKPDVALKRLQERDGDGSTRDGRQYIEWQEEATSRQSGFDHVMDTSTLLIHDCVTACAEALNIPLSDAASAMGVEWDIVQSG